MTTGFEKDIRQMSTLYRNALFRFLNILYFKVLHSQEYTAPPGEKDKLHLQVSPDFYVSDR